MQRNLVIVFALIAALSIGFAVYEFNETRAANSALAALDRERGDLRKRLWDAEKRRNELSQEIASLRAGTDAIQVTDTRSDRRGRSDASRQNGDNQGQGRRGGGMDANAAFGRAQAVVNSPEMQRLIAMQQKVALDARYGPLFKGLGLTPTQTDQLKELLLDKQNAARDVFEAARSQGLGRGSRDEIEALIVTSNSDINSGIKSLLGDTAYAQYQQYEQTLPQRNVVDQLASRLNYSSNPLTGQQADQLVSILAATTPQNTRGGGPTGGGGGGGTGGPGFGGRGSSDRGGGGFGEIGGMIAAVTGVGAGGGAPLAPITNAAVAQAQSVLTQPQLQALQQLQAQQQAQLQIQQTLRAAFENQGGQSGGGNRPTGGQTATGTTPTTTPATGATGGTTSRRRPGG